jgi:5-formyltetrahydrofolate cyclo-ligase
MSNSLPSAMNAIQSAKRELRAAMLVRRRDQSSFDRKSAAESLKRNFTADLMPPVGTIVSGYWPMEEEMDIRPLMTALHEHGCALALPVVAAKRRPLVFRQWRPGDKLVTAEFGLSEPAAGTPEIVPQMLLVPLVAFDAFGNRLGFGGGFYDRTLSALRTANSGLRAIGIAFAFQKADDVPHDKTDQRLDAVVTERGVTKIAKGGPLS